MVTATAFRKGELVLPIEDLGSDRHRISLACKFEWTWT